MLAKVAFLPPIIFILYLSLLYSEKPSIDLSHIKEITVRAGQEIKIPVPIKGWPVPTATWELGDVPLEKGGRNKMEVWEFMDFLSHIQIRITIFIFCKTKYLHIREVCSQFPYPLTTSK